MKNFLLIIGFSAVLAVGLAGCSGGSEAGVSGGEITVHTNSLSKAQFIKRADAACKSAIAEAENGFHAFLRRATSAAKRESPNARAENLVDTVVLPAYRKQIVEVRTLGAPSGDQEEVSTFLSVLEEELEGVKKHPLRFIRSESHLPETERLAAAYGFTKCGGTYLNY